MKSLVLLFTIVLSASSFAAEDKLEEVSVICSSTDSPTVLSLKVNLRNDAKLALGRYAFQASSDQPIIPSSFAAPKSDEGVYTIVDNDSFSILANQASNDDWVVLVSFKFKTTAEGESDDDEVLQRPPSFDVQLTCES